MDIKHHISSFVEANSIAAPEVITYEGYIKTELGDFQVGDCDIYMADDIISFTGWNTLNAGVEELAYTTISNNMLYGARFKYDHEIRTRTHIHNYIELAYVVEGRFIQQIEGKDETFFEGEICIMHSNSRHADYLLKEDSTVVFIGIEPAFIDSSITLNRINSDAEDSIRQIFAQEKKSCSFLHLYPIGQNLRTAKTLEIIVEELLNTQPYKISIIKGYLERLIMQLPQEYRFISAGERKAEYDPLIDNIKKIVENEYPSITVQKISDMVNYSTDHLNRRFFKQTGLTISEYIINYRIKKAFSLLLNTNLSIVEIARKVGYSNMGFFYKKFRECYQTTPNEIRNEDSGK